MYIKGISFNCEYQSILLRGLPVYLTTTYGVYREKTLSSQTFQVTEFVRSPRLSEICLHLQMFMSLGDSLFDRILNA